MYAPFRLPPLDSFEPLTFEKDFSMSDGDLEELAPQLILLRFDGKGVKGDGEGLQSYTFHFSQKFATGKDRDHLEFHIHALHGEELEVCDKVYTFSSATYVSGNKAQYHEGHIETLLPHTTFHFLDITYTLISFECIQQDIFDALYHSTLS